MSYPSSTDSFSNPVGTTLLSNDHALEHRNVGSAVVAIETVLGTNSGTSVLKNFVSGNFPARINSSNVLQQALSGTLTMTGGTVTTSVIGTNSIIGGTLSGQIQNNGTIANGVYGTALFVGGTANNGVIGTPAVTGGTSTSTTFVTPAFSDAAIPARRIATGAMLQAVGGTYSTSTNNVTTTYADTGLAGTITVTFSSSKILVLVTQADCTESNGQGVKLQLLSGGTSVYVPSLFSSIQQSRFPITFQYLDTPGATGSRVYKTQFAGGAASSPNATVQVGGASSSITLIEIAG